MTVAARIESCAAGKYHILVANQSEPRQSWSGSRDAIEMTGTAYKVSRFELCQPSLGKVEDIIHRRNLLRGKMLVILQVDSQAVIVPPQAGDEKGIQARKRIVQDNDSAAGGRSPGQELKLLDQAPGFDSVPKMRRLHIAAAPLAFVSI